MTGLVTGLVTQAIEPTPGVRALGIDAYPTSTGEVLGATAEEAFIRNPLPTIYRFLERQEFEAETRPFALTRGGPVPIRGYDPDSLLTAEEATARYGIPGELTFDAPIARGSAEQLRDLKRGELQRRSVFRRARGGLLETAGQLGVGLAVSALDPLNIASAFIPVVGPSRYALWAARLGKPGARLARGALEGAVGAAAVEPIIYAGARAEQADYGAADSLLNLAFGTALGGGLHLGAGWLADRLAGRAPSALEATADAAGAGTREAALRGAVAAVAEGRPVRVAEALAESDPAGREFDRLAAGEGRPVGDDTLFGGGDELTAPGLLGRAPAAPGFELGAAAGEGARVRYADYTKPRPGDRQWLEGAVAEVEQAEPGSRLLLYNEDAPGSTVIASKGTFPKWFQDMNRAGDKVTTELVQRTGRKLLAGEALGAHEARVALELMGRARALRAAAARDLLEARRERVHGRRPRFAFEVTDRAAELDRIAAQEAAFWDADEQAAAAAIDGQVQATLRQPEAIDAESRALEQEIAELESQLEGRGADTAAGGQETGDVEPPAGERGPGGLAEDEQRYLDEADELIAAAEGVAGAYDAGARCLVGAV